MQEKHVAVAGLEGKLADRLQERQPLDVAGRAANFSDDHVGLGLLGDLVNAVLNLIGDVRDHLDGFAQIIAAPFLVQHRLIDLAAGQIVDARKFRAREPLVVAEVQVGFRPIVEHVHFAVLERAHGARIDVEVGVEFLQRDFEPAIFQQRPQRGGRQAFAQRTDYAARDENVFHF